jgi:transposase
MKISSIAHTLKRPWTTVYRVLQRFEANGHKIVSRKCLCGRKKSAVPERVLNFLKCEQTLEEQAWLSLQQRCAILEKRFRFKCTRKKLRSIYKDLNISYSRPKLVDFRAKRDAAALAIKRKEFATQINELVQAD